MAQSEHTATVDEQVLAILRDESLDFMTLSMRMRKRHNVGDQRIVDRALQRLRKAGKIRYLGGAGRLWTVL